METVKVWSARVVLAVGTMFAALAELCFSTVAAWMPGCVGAEWLAGPDDDMGAEWVEGDDEMGRRRRIRLPRRPPVPVPAGPTLTGKRVPLGMETAAFAIAAPAGTTASLVCEPQRAYQGERLVLAAIDSNGVDIINNIRVTSIKVGDKEQLPFAGAEVIPGGLFRADAVGVGLDLSLAKGGLKVKVTVALRVALAAGVSAQVDAGFVGRVVGE